MLSRRPHAAHAAGPVDVRDPRRDRRRSARGPGTSSRRSRASSQRRHPLRHDLDQARHRLERRVRRHAARRRRAARGGYVTAFCDGGYTTNLPVEDITGGKAWVVYDYDGYELEPEHGGPARLLVPHLYFWKSAKWVRGLLFTDEDDPGFWETLGYHDRGDPWLEQRYQGD